MEPTAAHQNGRAATSGLDPQTASVDNLLDVFPELGLFAAEDIVAWREKNGSFPDQETLASALGLEPALAAAVTNSLAPPPPSSEASEEEHAADAPPPMGDDESGLIRLSDAEELRAILSDEPHARAAANSVELPAAAPAAPAPASEPPPALLATVKSGKVAAPSPVVAAPPPVVAAPPPVVAAPPPVVAAPPPVVAAPPPVVAAPPPVVAAVAPAAAAAAAHAATIAEKVAAAVAAKHAASPAEDAKPAVAAVPVAAPAGRTRIYVLVAVLVGVNAGLGAGMMQLRRESQRAVAPIAAMSADVTVLQTGQAETRTKIDETRAQLEEARGRLTKQEAALAKTVESITATTARQKAVEQEIKERDAREARELAGLAYRVRSVEKGVADRASAMSLTDALKTIDAVVPPAPVRSGEIKTDKHEKSHGDRLE